MSSKNTAPTLKDLPPPPQGKTGWPWTEQTEPLPEHMSDGSQWPRISVVTPNYNYAPFLEETIRSILLQGYPNLQYIVIDGGSTDNSVEIIRKYAPWIDYWVSERDRGQASAINKALHHVDGQIFNWINSDDWLTIGALGNIAKNFGQSDSLGGQCRIFYEGKESESYIFGNANLTASNLVALKDDLAKYNQQAAWLRPKIIKEFGGWNEDLHYSFDLDLMIKYLHHYPNIRYIDNVIANFRLHDTSKTIESRKGVDFFRDDLIISLKQLVKSENFSSLHSKFHLKLRQIEWRKTLQEIRYDYESPVWKRRLKILTYVLDDPWIRLRRNTWGALRKSFSLPKAS